jgi:DNA-binding MarR family transcriptional regulator
MSGVTHLSHPTCVLADEVVRLSARLKSVFSEATAQSGLSALAYTVFIYIAESSAPPTVPQIGRSIGHVRQVIQRAVHDLIGLGLVETMPNPNHKRAPLLQLSAEGEEFKRKSDSRVTRIGDELLRHLDEKACVQAISDLRKVRGQIEEYLRHAPTHE